MVRAGDRVGTSSRDSSRETATVYAADQAPTGLLALLSMVVDHMFSSFSLALSQPTPLLPSPYISDFIVRCDREDKMSPGVVRQGELLVNQHTLPTLTYT